jgi:hypothetical protein
MLIAIALLDVFLGEARKERLADIELRVWYWLARARDHSLLDWLRKHEGFLYLLAVIVQFGYLYWLYFHTNMLQHASNVDIHGGSVPTGVLIFFTFLFCIIIGNWLAYDTLQAPTLPSALFRLSRLLCFSLGILSLVAGLSFVLPDEILSTPQPDDLFRIAYLKFFAFIVTLNFAASLLVCWVIVAVPLVVVTLCTGCFAILEFILRRLAEYPKGALLGLSAILGTIAGLFKLFG